MGKKGLTLKISEKLLYKINNLIQTRKKKKKLCETLRKERQIVMSLTTLDRR